jgi:hypothetical protein
MKIWGEKGLINLSTPPKTEIEGQRTSRQKLTTWKALGMLRSQLVSKAKPYL